MGDIAKDAFNLLEGTQRKVDELNLVRDPRVTNLVKTGGKLVKLGTHVVDSYLPYKSQAKEAVTIGVLQEKGATAKVVVHHRRVIDGRLQTVGVDEFGLQDDRSAEVLFLANAEALAAPSHSWTSRHDSDEN